MGALTLKSFSFVLRSWEVRSYDSIDPTDAFGQGTSVYLNKNKIIKIEPRFSNQMSNIWLTDKGRHFFDSIFTKSECFGVSSFSSVRVNDSREGFGKKKLAGKNCFKSVVVFKVSIFKF